MRRRVISKSLVEGGGGVIHLTATPKFRGTASLPAGGFASGDMLAGPRRA
jgi:hypothetical protein